MSDIQIGQSLRGSIAALNTWASPKKMDPGSPDARQFEKRVSKLASQLGMEAVRALVKPRARKVHDDHVRRLTECLPLESARDITVVKGILRVLQWQFEPATTAAPNPAQPAARPGTDPSDSRKTEVEALIARLFEQQRTPTDSGEVAAAIAGTASAIDVLYTDESASTGHGVASHTFCETCGQTI